MMSIKRVFLFTILPTRNKSADRINIFIVKSIAIVAIDVFSIKCKSRTPSNRPLKASARKHPMIPAKIQNVINCFSE